MVRGPGIQHVAPPPGRGLLRAYVCRSIWQPHLELISPSFEIAIASAGAESAAACGWMDDEPGQLPEVPSGVWSTASGTNARSLT